MADTYYLTETTEAIPTLVLYSEYLLDTSAGSTPTTVAFGTSGTLQSGWITTSGSPGGSLGSAYTATVTLSVQLLTAGAGGNVRCYLARMDSGGTIQDTTFWRSYVGVTAGAGYNDKTFFFDSTDPNDDLGTWTTGDRLIVVVECQNTYAGGATFYIESDASTSLEYVSVPNASASRIRVGSPPNSVHPSHIQGRAIRSMAPNRGAPRAAASLSVTRNAQGEWVFTWTGNPLFEIWLDGYLLTTQASTTYTYTGGVYVDDAPPLEVIEVGVTAENFLYPPFVKLQWRGIQAADSYVVQLFDSGWIDVGTITEDGRGYYTWDSQPEDDATLHSYRVLGVTVNAEGTPIAYDIPLVRNPAPPDVDLEIDSNGDLVVSAV